jgi:hypothetical protein
LVTCGSSGGSMSILSPSRELDVSDVPAGTDKACELDFDALNCEDVTQVCLYNML